MCNSNLYHYRKMRAAHMRGWRETVSRLREVKQWIVDARDPKTLAAHLHFRASLQKKLQEKATGIDRYSGLIELEKQLAKGATA
jgi:hypothetical protein